jgi:hypothetical protein
MSKNDNAFALLERFSRSVDQNVALMRERDPAIARQLETASALPSIPRKKRRAESVLALQSESSTASVSPFRSIRIIGDRLTGGGLRALGNRLTGGGIRAMGKRIAKSFRDLSASRRTDQNVPAGKTPR